MVVLCAVSVFLGTEFTNVVNNAQIWYDLLTGQQTIMDVPGVLTDRVVNDKLIQDLLEDNLAAGQEEAAQRLRDL